MYMSEKIPMENTVSCYQGRREGGGGSKRGPDTNCYKFTSTAGPLLARYSGQKGPGHSLCPGPFLARIPGQKGARTQTVTNLQVLQDMK